MLDFATVLLPPTATDVCLYGGDFWFICSSADCWLLAAATALPLMSAHGVPPCLLVAVLLASVSFLSFPFLPMLLSFALRPCLAASCRLLLPSSSRSSCPAPADVVSLALSSSRLYLCRCQLWLLLFHGLSLAAFGP